MFLHLRDCYEDIADIIRKKPMKKKKTKINLSKNQVDNRKKHRDITPLVELIQLLQSVDTISKDAKLNEISMSDNNGGRIWF